MSRLADLEKNQPCLNSLIKTEALQSYIFSFFFILWHLQLYERSVVKILACRSHFQLLDGFGVQKKYKEQAFLASPDNSRSNHTGMFAAFQMLSVVGTAKNVIFLCVSGSTFKPLNSVKRSDKNKKRNRRTTIMGIPNQVQKELGINKRYPVIVCLLCVLILMLAVNFPVSSTAQKLSESCFYSAPRSR